jgi:AmiR/NasT family two-component response regulator
VSDEIARLEQEVADLRAALESSRTIGLAMGILMERYSLTPELAFAHLRRLSMERNQKIRDLAAEMARSDKSP